MVNVHFPHIHNHCLSSFQFKVLVWLPALSPYRSSQHHRRCLIGHCSLTNLQCIFIFSSFITSIHHCNTSLLSTLERRYKENKFHFILSICVSRLADFITVDNTVRISLNTSENVLILSEKLSVTLHLPVASVGEVWLFPTQTGRTECLLPRGKKPLKCSLSLYISIRILTLQATEQGYTREH